MEVIRLEAVGVQAAARSAAAMLRNKGVILYPTDTLYGLGADAFSDEAVDRIYAIKGRDPQKPIHAIFADMPMIEQYAEVNDVARKLAKRFLPGPLTLVLKKKHDVAGGIVRGMQTIGVRIPANQFCIETGRAFGAPYTATSANVAGLPTETSVEKILAQLGENTAQFGIVFDAGVLVGKVPSTVVDVSDGVARVLRQGMIASVEIEKALASD